MKNTPFDSIEKNIWIDFIDGDDACFTLIYKNTLEFYFSMGVSLRVMRR